jgi:diacylglycerol kinase family enzyme
MVKRLAARSKGVWWITVSVYVNAEGTGRAIPAEMSQSSTGKIAHLIANSRSGKGHGQTIHEKVSAIADELGFTLVFHEVSEPSQLEAKAKEAVQAAIGDGGVILAAGGDGTVRTVAEVTHGTSARFAVIPCGTFNYFARTHKVPEDHDAAIRLAMTGDCRPVRLGEMNGRIFLINASIGMYAKSIHEREKNTDRFGRNRAVAILSTMRTFLSDHLLLKVSMSTDTEKITMRTPMIFIGNNALQLRNLKMDVARCMKKDLMAMVALKPLGRWEMLRVIARGILHTIEKEERLESFCIDSLTIHSHPRFQTVALDGELFPMSSPFDVKALPETLRMMLPPREEPK